MSEDTHLGHDGAIAGAAPDSVNDTQGFKHTPGPWSFFDGEFTTEIRAPDNSKIADAHSYSRKNDSYRPDKQRRLANGRLMAAAPDMLAALKTARGVIDEHKAPLTFVRINDAIAKATGVKS